MPKVQQNLIGKIFYDLTIIEDLGMDKGLRYVKTKCKCGNQKVICLNSIKRGSTKSCGCFRKIKCNQNLPPASHGLSHTALYTAYIDMNRRCYSSSCVQFKNYGGRGITVCEEWLNDFLLFYKWGMENGYKKGLDIDRIENDKGYSPDNCRFVTRTVNARNKRSNLYLNFNGDRKTISEWAEITGIGAQKISNRIRKQNWNVERTLTTI